MEKEDFDRYTKGEDSPAKSAARFTKGSLKKFATNYEPESLIEYE